MGSGRFLLSAMHLAGCALRFFGNVFNGFSARPLAGWYGRFAQGLPDGSPELLGEVEPRRASWTFHEHPAEHPRSGTESPQARPKG